MVSIALDLNPKMNDLCNREVNLEMVAFDKILNINMHALQNNEKAENNAILRRYFIKWKTVVKSEKQKEMFLSKNIDEENKLDKFINKLKRKTKAKSANHGVMDNDKDCNINNKDQQPMGNYKNRFSAQKTVIEMQRAKLQEQNQIIEELKLGIIREDLMKSIENSKTNIHDIFSNCSERLKNKAPLIIQPEEREKFMIATQKAPKVIQKMEQRAIERANNRQIILERKRVIEETRKKLLEEVIEKKKALEEEERRRALEMIKERRKKELLLEKIRQEKRQEFLERWNKAEEFHNFLLLKQCFQKIINNYQMNKCNFNFAQKHYENKVVRKIWNCWSNYIEDKYKIKYEIANAHFYYKILKLSMHNWTQLCVENKRNMQVSEDLYDFRLMSNTFIWWHRYVCECLTGNERKFKIADKHNNRRMLFQYFYQWRSLPVVIQLEKAKEEKKRKWREKVWELLPDYRPPEDM